jgi:hypothetical protein
MDSAVLFNHDEFGAAPAIGTGKTHPVGVPQGLGRRGRRLQPEGAMPEAEGGPGSWRPGTEQGGERPPCGDGGVVDAWPGAVGLGPGAPGQVSAACRPGLDGALLVRTRCRWRRTSPASQPASQPEDQTIISKMEACLLIASLRRRQRGPGGGAGWPRRRAHSHKFSPSNKKVPHWRVLLILRLGQPKRVGFRCPRSA